MVNNWDCFTSKLAKKKNPQIQENVEEVRSKQKPTSPPKKLPF